MRSAHPLPLVLSFLLIGGGLVAWWAASFEHAAVLAHLNAISPDGDVRSYSSAFHTRVQGHLIVLAVGLLALGLLVLAFRSKAVLVLAGERGPGHLRQRWLSVRKDLVKRTSPAHKRMVLLMLFVGVVVRMWMLSLPVTYDEAFTYTYYASRPLHIILVDHSYPNNHILHTLLVKLTTSVLGVGKVSLRLPAFIAGVLVMPLWYVFVRRMFNRHIGLLALAFVVASARLIEYSALGRGYSITWLFLIGELVLGRDLVKENSPFTAMLVGVLCALGMWTVPTMIYGAAMVYIWMFLSIWTRYKDSLKARLLNLAWSAVVFVVLTGLFYAPVLVLSGVEGMLHHDTMPDNDLATFSARYGDDALHLWAWFTDPSHYWVGVAGFMGLVFAAYISTKYRFLLAAMFLGAVPLVVVQLMVAPPRVWTYTLFIFHLGSAIALYYLLKLVHDKLWPAFSERRRTFMAALLITAAFVWPAMTVLLNDSGRTTQAADTAEYLSKKAGAQDRIMVQFPWEAPVEFEAIARGMDRAAFHRREPVQGRLFVVVGTVEGQSLAGVAAHNELPASDLPPMVMVQDHEGLKTFAAP